MTGDESLYRQYLSGDDEGLNALMKKYGDPLTFGYSHTFCNVHSTALASRSGKTRHLHNSLIDPTPFIQTNIVGTSVLINACRKYSGHRRHSQ